MSIAECSYRLTSEDADRCDQLRELLARAEFTQRGVSEALGHDALHAVSAQDIPLLLRRTGGGSPRDLLIRLLLIGVAVDAEAFRRAIAPMDLDAWIALGLAEREGNLVRGAVQLVPFSDLVLIYDRPPWAKGSPPDYVMGIGSSSLTLANATIRRRCERALDLGTGCGLLAFLAARHSERVVAVDRNPRAVRLAAMNARLNGLANVDCREGSFFEPVRGERFDLVVTNPPFVISPERSYIYRDSGMPGDGVTRSIVRQAPEHLAEGGFCQILCNWIHIAGEDWRERLAAWFEGTGCDAWVMRDDTLDAATYAARWIRHTERDAPERFDERFNAWLDYYDRERIEAVSAGLITLRRRTGPSHWLRMDDSPGKMLGPAGDAIVEGFALRDFLESKPDPKDWLGLKLKASPDARLDQRFAPAADGWEIAASELSLVRGLAYTGKIDPYMAALVTRCDGRRPLGELLAELAQSAEQDLATLAPACLEAIRRLVERGFLLPG